MIEMAAKSKSYLAKFEKGAGYKEGHFFQEAKTLGLKSVVALGQSMAKSSQTTTTSSTSTWFGTAAKLAGTLATIAAKEGLFLA